ncbi:MAG: FAD synthetase family protein [Armatimonadota bacterium]|nr:FAD synthetase family protein [Armatimonadota bacterium]MDR7443268.1 FAD synthetase family protein [Armatimonadota bacterium]MDR7569935.1 FAD synthetase family protein [Armatimonadota bacterium]MDR7614402.1 FAD synthetase family protein [Armatimonadota bacterium]
MRVFHAPEEVPPAPTCIALGTFDGVHLGHRAVLERTVAWSREQGWRSMALTFHPHPLEILAPPPEPFLLTTLEERIERMAATGLQALLVLRFDEALRNTEPHAFVEMLVHRLGVRGVVCGPGFAFGRDRKGDVHLLERLGTRMGFAVRVCPPVEVGGAAVSSSRIRALLREGRVEEATALLGGPYEARVRLRRQVQEAGGVVGWCEVPSRKLVPAPGAYGVQVGEEGEGVVQIRSQELILRVPRPLPALALLRFVRRLDREPVFAPGGGA